jgi:hypothetical protein
MDGGVSALVLGVVYENFYALASSFWAPYLKSLPLSFPGMVVWCARCLVLVARDSMLYRRGVCRVGAGCVAACRRLFMVWLWMVLCVAVWSGAVWSGAAAAGCVLSW